MTGIAARQTTDRPTLIDPLAYPHSAGWLRLLILLVPATVAHSHTAMQGTYLLLEKLRYAVYRRLLRVVHGVHAELEPEKRTQIPLPQFQTALALQVRTQWRDAVGWGQGLESGGVLHVGLGLGWTIVKIELSHFASTAGSILQGYFVEKHRLLPNDCKPRRTNGRLRQFMCRAWCWTWMRWSAWPPTSSSASMCAATSRTRTRCAAGFEGPSQI